MVSSEAHMLLKLKESVVTTKEQQPRVTAVFWLTAAGGKMVMYVSTDIAHIAKSV